MFKSNSPDHILYAHIATAGGQCVMLWNNKSGRTQRLLRVYPVCPDAKRVLRAIRAEYPQAKLFNNELPTWLKSPGRFLMAYYSGDRNAAARAQLGRAWINKHLDWSSQTEFARQVLMATCSIKPGTTASYGQLARHIGRPHAARAVGGALARNPWPVIIPCHRVIGTDGSMTGFSGYGDVSAKQWMLNMERPTG